MSFLKMLYSGSLAGYDGSGNKIWDSHESYRCHAAYSIELDEFGANSGASGTNVLGEQLAGSTLNMTEDGVFIQLGEQVTWKVNAPSATQGSNDALIQEPSSSPTASPSIVSIENIDSNIYMKNQLTFILITESNT
jgi:hypothetical protein